MGNIFSALLSPVVAVVVVAPQVVAVVVVAVVVVAAVLVAVVVTAQWYCAVPLLCCTFEFTRTI